MTTQDITKDAIVAGIDALTPPRNDEERSARDKLDAALRLPNAATAMIAALESLLALHIAHHNTIEHAHARKIVRQAKGEA